MANRNDLQASGNVIGNLRIENNYAINLMVLPAIKGGFALHTFDLEVPVNQ